MKSSLVFLAALLPAAVAAQGFGPLRYDFVGASLALPELDEIGVEVEGSTEVIPNLVVFGTYRDFAAVEHVDVTTRAIGVGRFFDFRPNLDLMASLSYADNAIDSAGLVSDEEGLILGAHARGWLTQRFELNGALLLDNSTGSHTETVLELGGQFFRYSNLSFGGHIRAGEDDSALFLGTRFYFGASRR